MNEENLRKQEESIAKQEQMKKCKASLKNMFVSPCPTHLPFQKAVIKYFFFEL